MIPRKIIKKQIVGFFLNRGAWGNNHISLNEIYSRYPPQFKPYIGDIISGLVRSKVLLKSRSLKVKRYSLNISEQEKIDKIIYY